MSYLGTIDWFNWVIMPIIIIFARIFDVSFATIRVVLTSRGEKKLAAITGFFEVLLWLIIIQQIITNIQHPIWYVAYAFGYALGTYIGMSISERISVGRVLVRVITKKDGKPLIEALRKKGLGVTRVSSSSKKSSSTVFFTVIHTKDLESTIEIIQKFNPKAFITVEDVRKVSEGRFTQPFSTKKILSNAIFQKNVKRK